MATRSETARDGHPWLDDLSAADQAAVTSIAATITAAVLARAESEADLVAQKVVEKLRQAPTPVAEPQALFISVSEAATLLGITRAALDKRIARRQVPGVVRTAGRRVQIDRERLLSGLAKRGR